MKVHFTTAARIAEASMNLTWKENVRLFLWVAFSGVIILLVMPLVLVVAGIVSIVGVAATFAFTWNAVVTYADILTYPGVAAVCIGAAWLFAKAREAKPRKFFDWLARGMFWYFTTIASLLVLAGSALIVREHGWPTAIGVWIAILAGLKGFEILIRK